MKIPLYSRPERLAESGIYMIFAGYYPPYQTLPVLDGYVCILHGVVVGSLEAHGGRRR